MRAFDVYQAGVLIDTVESHEYDLVTVDEVKASLIGKGVFPSGIRVVERQELGSEAQSINPDITRAVIERKQSKSECAVYAVQYQFHTTEGWQVAGGAPRMYTNPIDMAFDIVQQLKPKEDGKP